YRYNALGNVVSVTYPDGSRADSVYSDDAKLVAQTDAAGYTTGFTYDRAGNLLSATDPLGRTLKLTWDPAANLLTSYQNARGIVTRFEYDSRGNLIRSIQPLSVETRQTWDAAGSLTSVTDAEGHTFTAAYDSYGNQSESRDALGNATAFEFDRLNRLIRTVDPEGGESRGEYDALDRVVREVNPLGLAATAAYDRDGRATGATDFGGRARKFRFDSLNHLTQAVDPLGQTTEYGYKSPECACPASANLSLFRDAGGTTRSQTYDFQGRLTAATDPLGNTTRYQYDSRGDIARKTDANGNATVFEYDAAGQLTRKVFADGTDVRFSYDASGNLLTAANRHVALQYTYDELDRVVRVADSRFGKSIEYGYNRVGLRTSMTDSDGGVTRYSYDANRRLVSLTAPSGHELGFDYDARGNPIAIRYPGEQTATLRYDAAGRVGEVKNAGGTFAYSYDKAGNPVEISGAADSHVFQYDELDRLTAARHDASPAERYTYDAAGNRKSSATDPAYRYDAAGRLQAAENATFAYDKNGNLVRRTAPNGTTTYTWNAENQLVRVELPGGGAVTYKYDPFGRRIEKNVNGRVTAWLYDRDNILAEMDESGLVRARYTHGAGIDQPLALDRDGQAWFLQADAGGNVVALSDASGNLVRSFAYDSWGRLLSAEESGPASPFRFAGREYDPESGLYYMRARYYDPAVGRFIAADPLDLPGMLVSGQSKSNERALLPQAAAEVLRRAGQGPISWLRAQAQRVPERLNAYAYAGNNPLRWRDPSGLDYCIKSQLVSRYVVDENGVWHYIWSERVEWQESTNPLFQVVKFLAGLLPDKPVPPGSIVTVRVGPVTVRPAPVPSVVASSR
ncbi:MAG: RHS repeat-associated core domain-containing protein, partial [Bryobacterales bacterium]|nr:RHS repeat-associated core domain-containing protein [Bryobacterales bacterium]